MMSGKNSFITREMISCAKELNLLHGNKRGVGHYLGTKNYEAITKISPWNRQNIENNLDNLKTIMYKELKGLEWGALENTILFWREPKKQDEIDAEFEWITKYPAFKNWCQKYDFNEDASTYRIDWIEIQQIDSFSKPGTPSKGFLKFEPGIKKKFHGGNWNSLPSIIFMRGDSVCILVILKCEGRKYVVLTNQPRVPTGKREFLEIPAGMIDASSIISAAITEMNQETGIIVERGELINMPEVLGLSHNSLYMSPGGCDEAISFFLYEAQATKQQLSEINKRIKGEAGEGEEIKVVITDLDNMIKKSADAKSVIAHHYYELLTKNDVYSTILPNTLKTHSDTLIISSGDVSDVDGLYALAKYAATKADVIFVMNYPAYIKHTHEDMSVRNGLGYVYETIRLFETALSKYSATSMFPSYETFLSKYGIATDGTCSSGVALSHAMYQMLTDIAFEMATRVWKDTKAEGQLYFCVGGINDINPFHYSAIKNEILVYARSMGDIKTLNSVDEGKIYYQTGTSYDQPLLTLLQEHNQVFIDFNGSMAFLNDAWINAIESISRARKLKAAVVMGGVYADKAPLTMPAIKDTLNRFSCSTMNQLYSPAKTNSFFQLMQSFEVPVYIIANNAVESIETFDPSNSKIKTDAGWKTFLASNNLNIPSLQDYCQAYYNSPFNPPRKPFDYYTGETMFALVKHKPPTCIPKELFFDVRYGVALLGPDQSTSESTLKNYIGRCDTTPDENDGDFIKNKKISFKAEQRILFGLTYKHLHVLAVEPPMDKTTFKIELK